MKLPNGISEAAMKCARRECGGFLDTADDYHFFDDDAVLELLSIALEKKIIGEELGMIHGQYVGFFGTHKLRAADKARLRVLLGLVAPTTHE